MSILEYYMIVIGVYIIMCIGISALCVGISDIEDRVNREQLLKELNSVNTSFIINGIEYTWDDTKRVFRNKELVELEKQADELEANYFG